MQENFRHTLAQICTEYPDLKIVFSHSFWETDFLRFYQSQINYNISKTSSSLYTKVYKGKRSLAFMIYDADEKKLRSQLEASIPILDQLPEDPDFVDIENNLELYPEKTKVNNIERMSIDLKLEILNKIASAVQPYGFQIYGTFICNYQTDYLINSNGLNKKDQTSPIMLELKAVSGKNMVTVLETFGSEKAESFQVDTFISNLLKKVEVASHEVVDVDPGHYDVILAPRCIGEYIAYLSGAMSAESLDQKMSFFEGKTDQKVFPEMVTITDDPHHPEIINFDYNYDGHIYKRLPLIEKGVFKNFMVGNYYSYKTGLPKNGNNGAGIVMEAGDQSLEAMISGIKRGIYISSLHYMNFINYKETSLTGLTRDGTFLIEDGKLSKVVCNLRFTERISRILESIVAVEDTCYTIPNSGNYDEFSIGTTRMPHVKVTDFHITSSTKTI